MTRRIGSNLILRIRCKRGKAVELPFKGTTYTLPDFESLVGFIRANGPIKLIVPEEIVKEVNILEVELTIRQEEAK